MQFDLSTILLVVIAVIPGYFALKSRYRVVPRSFVRQGATAELAELASLGIITHAILAIAAALLLFLFGLTLQRCGTFYLTHADEFLRTRAYRDHPLTAAIGALVYILVSFLAGYGLGFAYGILELRKPFSRRLFRRNRTLFGLSTLLVEVPFIYEILHPPSSSSGSLPVFVEIEMKQGGEYYSGQLSQFAIVKDQQPHKPIYLIDVFHRPNRNSRYEHLPIDGMMIDLADALTLSIRVQKPQSDSTPPPTTQPIPPPDPIRTS